jgi:dinuclear metal center YbgI/SA1388 family protein
VADLAAVVRHLETELRTSDVPDYDAALNGLQLANNGSVARIAAAVDFSSATVAAAIQRGADLLIVHHGMFWGGSQPLVGHGYARLRDAITANLAVYSSHLPLDLHPTLGNNALLAGELGLARQGTFGRYKDIDVGVCGGSDIKTSALFETVRGFSSRFRTSAVATPFEASRVTRQWAIVTGSGASSDTLAEAVEKKVDTLIVGEGPHHSAVLARDLGIVVMYAGHYATETLGVQAVAESLAKKFDLPHSFVDLPTGL